MAVCRGRKHADGEDVHVDVVGRATDTRCIMTKPSYAPRGRMAVDAVMQGTTRHSPPQPSFWIVVPYPVLSLVNLAYEPILLLTLIIFRSASRSYDELSSHPPRATAAPRSHDPRD